MPVNTKGKPSLILTDLARGLNAKRRMNLRGNALKGKNIVRVAAG